jgi:hypothetical protein
MNSKKTLLVPIFGQHWFHLGALAELIMKNRGHYSKVILLFMRDGFLLKPHQIHHHRIFREFTAAPEQILNEFLLYKGIDSELVYSCPKKEKKSNSIFFETFDQLRSFEKENMKIGMAIGSELITLSKSATPKLKKYEKFINLAMKTSKQITEVLDQEVKNYKERDLEIWICNGRPFHERMVVEFCRSRKIKHEFYEVILDEVNGEMRPILHPKSPHSRLDFQAEMVKFSENHFDRQRAMDWFNDRTKQNIFTKNQKTIFKFNSNKILISFFTSSDDELIAVSEEWISPWGNQINCANELLSLFGESDTHELIIRVHPNMLRKSEKDKKRWIVLKKTFPDRVILWNQNIDSYSLMEQSAAVLVHGSTMGIEALYHEKPTGLLCHSRYDEIITAKKIFRIEEMVNWKENNFEMPLNAKVNSEKSLIWGNYLNLAGDKWTNLKFKKTIWHGLTPMLINKKLKPNYVIIFVSRSLNYLEYLVRVV